MDAMRRFWRAETGFFLGIWVFLMVGGRSRLFRDPGTFWHTVVGRKILATGTFLDTDPFSFTLGGRPWIPHQWLGECLMAVLDGIGGLDTLLLATATILACLYTWVARRLVESGLHWLPTALVVMLTIAAGANHLHVRPHVSSIVGLGLTFGWLADFEARRMGLDRLAWLVPLFWAWSNLHGGVLGGLATMALAIAGWCAWRLAGLESPIERFRQAPYLGLLLVACTAVSVANPYGLRLPRSWLEIMGSPVVARLIEEHAPLDVAGPVGWLVLSLGFLYAGTLASLRPWRPRVTWLIPLFWFGQALLRVRHSPLFAITAALAIAEMLPQTRLAAFLARPGRDLFRFPEVGSRRTAPNWGPALIPMVVVALALGLQAAGVKAPIVGRGWARLDPAHWPVELLPDLRQIEQESPEGTRIFNDLLYGGFLIYHTPGLKVFIDDRCELYGDDRLVEYAEAMTSNPARIEQWRDANDIPYALVVSDSAMDRYLARAPGWSLLRRTGTAALYRHDRAASASGVTR